MKIEITPALVRSYFNGSCTRMEKVVVENWLKSADDNFLKAMRWLKEEESDENEKFLAGLLVSEDEVFDKIQHAIEDKELILNSRPENKIERGFWYIAAASISVIILATWMMNSYHGKNTVTIKTSFGETQRITLPDSSVVILNSNSSVSYMPGRFGKERQIWMQGEVFFDIRHLSDSEIFQVHLSDEKTVEVLGTEFNISEREKMSRITLKSSKIRLDLPYNNRKIELLPGEMVKVDAAHRSVVRSNVNAELFYSWIDGKWKFDSTSLSEIFSMIEETRGVKVDVYDRSLKIRTISGTIPLKGNARTLITNVANAFDLIVEDREGTFYLKERKK